MWHDADYILRVEGLRIGFDGPGGCAEAVRGVSFDLKRGATLGVVGESGSGKSLTGLALMGLVQRPGRIMGGKILLRLRDGGEVDVAAMREGDEALYRLRGSKVAMVFQEPMTALSPVHSVGEQIAEAVRVHRKARRAEAWEAAREMLERVGVEDAAQRMRQYPFEFSGGMRQRVVIAMALVCRPEVLIADEPTTALDVTVQAQVLTLIDRLKRELGTSVILISHDLGVIAQAADDVVVMKSGEIVERGTVREVLKTPKHEYTRRLLAAVPRFEDVEVGA
jgi:ABC-type dipeptide/oligopeptide/nickel transport system ATPase component